MDELTVRQWLAERETEHLEFKAAENSMSRDRALEYIVALANEGGGCLVLGITDDRPRVVCGTRAFRDGAQDDLKLETHRQTGLRVDIFEINIESHRVLVIKVSSRPKGRPIGVGGRFLMRLGESLVPMSIDQITAITSEGSDSWFHERATDAMTATEALGLIDARAYFDMRAQPFPSTEPELVERLIRDHILLPTTDGVALTNVGALTLALRLSSTSEAVARRAVRIVIYDGRDKATTRFEVVHDRGYAVGFADLI